MRKAAAHIAYRAVRCHGTIGGSVAMADPAADWPAVLLALDATAVVLGEGGERRLGMNDLLTGTYTTSLEPGEIIIGFEVRKLGASARTSYVKFNKKVGAFASSLAVAVRDGDRLRIVLAGAGPRATLLERTAQAALNHTDTNRWRDMLEAEVAAIVEEADPYACALHVATLSRAIGDIS
jgi:carbon-monoxide dehydrogenase medium subunit